MNKNVLTEASVNYSASEVSLSLWRNTIKPYRILNQFPKASVKEVYLNLLIEMRPFPFFGIIFVVEHLA